MINNKTSKLHNKGTRTMRNAIMLLLQHRLLRDGKEDMDHSALEIEATVFL